MSFIEARNFRRVWNSCGLGDADLFALQLYIMADPKDAPVIKGSGGLRKLRFSPSGTNKGKSGSHRACYVYYEEYGVVLLVTTYPKSKKAKLSAGALKAIRQMIQEQQALLAAQGRIL